MSPAPIIALGQQPCGFFPKRFLVAKFNAARRLQAEIGGEIIFFYHDSDHDPRETHTILRHRKTNDPAQLNFAFLNKIQRKFSPLHLKRIAPDWQKKTELQLPNYLERLAIEIFTKVSAENAADFCLAMYQGMGLLEGIKVVRSSDPLFRRAACAVPDFFVDVPYQAEIVRARFSSGTPAQEPSPPVEPKSPGSEEGSAGTFTLHEGGNSFITLPATPFSKEQISPTRDTRLRWMQSVLHCTHYIAGASERDYLRHEEAPEITFITRDPIERFDEAYTEIRG
jgi:hypothetical protein